MNEHRSVLRIVGNLQELIRLLILRRLIRDGNMEILHTQFLHVRLFGHGIESSFANGPQIDYGRDSLRLQFGQVRGCRLPAAAEVRVDLEKVVNRRRLLRHPDNCYRENQHRRQNHSFHVASHWIGRL
jgi:hypothetical protein